VTPRKKKPPVTNLLAVPSPDTDDRLVNLADWVEIKALLAEDGNASQEDLARALEQAHSLDEEEAEVVAGDVFKELADRQDTCIPLVSKDDDWEYPFVLSDSSTLLQVRTATGKKAADAGVLYKFLLVTARADMDAQRRLENLDPTILFEQLCADILLNFWGGSTMQSGSMVFGTARNKSKENQKFRANIEQLCTILKEGRGLRAGAKAPGGGDGRLDIVVWKIFGDGRSGGLVGFGQCKTGIHWREHLEKLQPRNFCGNYMAQPLIIDPVRVYMVPHRVEKADWDANTRAGGLLFDRCRIVQYGYEVSKDVFNNCKKWLDAALRRQLEGNFAG
jgi:hypothetical protein